MSKKKRKQGRGGKKDSSVATPAVAARPDAPSMLQRLQTEPKERRRALQWIGGLGLASVGAFAIARYDSSQREQHDLSVIGNGVPVVVQVHDPSCPLCRRLMSATRTALEERPDVNYRVADLTSNEGRAFGETHRAGKVTLLLFDAQGNKVDRVEGVTPVEQLQALFADRFQVQPPPS